MKNIEDRLSDLEAMVFGNSYIPYTKEEQDFEDSLEEEDEDDRREREEDALLEMASSCTCGAWQIINNKVIHSADCICGAE